MVEISDDDYSAAAAAAGIVPVDGNDEPVSDANSENVPPQNRRSLTPPTARVSGIERESCAWGMLMRVDFILYQVYLAFIYLAFQPHAGSAAQGHHLPRACVGRGGGESRRGAVRGAG